MLHPLEGTEKRAIFSSDEQDCRPAVRWKKDPERHQSSPSRDALTRIACRPSSIIRHGTIRYYVQFPKKEAHVSDDAPADETTWAGCFWPTRPFCTDNTPSRAAAANFTVGQALFRRQICRLAS